MADVWYLNSELRREIDKLRAELEICKERISELQNVCAEAYQFAGAYDAPIIVLDKLSAAANGDKIPSESYLPIESPIK